MIYELKEWFKICDIILQLNFLFTETLFAMAVKLNVSDMECLLRELESLLPQSLMVCNLYAVLEINLDSAALIVRISTIES